MTRRAKFTLSHSKFLGGWALTDQSGRVVGIFNRKTDALAGGRVEKMLGEEGGSVRIHKLDGRFEEERTYPRRDRRTSPSS
jgi:hypothetical protein